MASYPQAMSARPELVSDDREGERALARRATSGDEAAFEQLYRTHSPRVFALCLRMSGSRARATELTQDVFVHVWQRLDSWRGDAAFSSWIHRVTVNLVLSNVRSETRRLSKEMNESELQRREEMGDRRGDSGSSPISHLPSPISRSVPDAIDLENAIAALPDGARAVFVLHDVEGYQHDEIAKMMGTAEGTSRAQLHRARKLLMETLER